jgi:CDGSH-type Zn-finger protein
MLHYNRQLSLDLTEALSRDLVEYLKSLSDAGLYILRSRGEVTLHMSDVTITPQNDGPYHVQGPFKIVTEGGRTIAVDGNETWLCRCGPSANKLFCDGTHARIGFKNNLDKS